MNAYVTLVFGGARYIPGVINLWYSLKKSSSSCDFICMYTHDVPKSMIKLLSDIGIKTKLVDYIDIETDMKQNDRYSSWASVSYTKWNCLKLIEYTKVVFLDADMLVLNNPDDIFNYKTPAGLFESQLPIKSHYKFKNGTEVDVKEIKNALTDMGFVATSTCIVLEPNLDDFTKLVYMLKSMQPFGLNSVSTFDEQSIAYYYSIYEKGPRCCWSHIDKSFAFLLKDNNNINNIKIIDYYGIQKPWDINSYTRQDLKYWWDSWESLLKEYPAVQRVFSD